MAFTIEKIQDILKFIDSNKQIINNSKDKLTIYEGELLPYVERAMMMELSPSAFERARKRIAPINMLPKIVNKLSTLYNNTVIRVLKEESTINQDIVDYYKDELRIDDRGQDSNKQLNLNKYTAWEIYISEEGEPTPKLRVLPANQFLVYSDNMEDPTKETVFIKILGQYNKNTGLINEADGSTIFKDVIIYKLYDKDQIIVIDSDGEVRPEFMVGNEQGINPYGTIPFVYIRKAKYSLIPREDTSDIPMTILIPILLTDLNYATQFMSHSIIYAIDADITNLSGNPDSIWHIKSDDSEIEDGTKKASIGTIKPEVDIDKVLQLIQTELALWLDSKDLKAQGIGSLEASNLASGISKMIDEADTTQAIRSQIEIYREAEAQLWKKLGKMHNIWVQQGFMVNTEINKTTDGELLVNTIFEEPQVVVNEKERIETIKLKEDSGYTSYSAAVAEANPELSKYEVELLIAEIEEDKARKNTIILQENNNDGSGNQNDEEEIPKEDGTEVGNRNQDSEETN